MKSNAPIKTTVLRNMVKSLTIKLEELVENSEADEKHQSPEISEDVWIIEAKTVLSSLLLKEAEKMNSAILFTAKQMMNTK